MSAAIGMSSVSQPGAHLRVVSDRPIGAPGIAISGVSKTYRSRDGDVPSLERAVALYRGPLLAACTQDWAFQERQPREQAFLGALETLAARAISGGDDDTAERHLRRAVATDPLRDPSQFLRTAPWRFCSLVGNAWLGVDTSAWVPGAPRFGFVVSPRLEPHGLRSRQSLNSNARAVAG